ncbi:MAG: class I SAM-dependent methyltransferase [Chloroflexi bacterium]|nr:MAG: class I SAM-dependent methyltransferase [Chloroflexota bacterium]
MAEPDSEWWRTWFGPSYLELYDETLRERTPVEIDQLERLLRLRPPVQILDLPCGQGRHAVELARRGYAVTGVDLSPYLLEVAKTRGSEAGVRVDWRLGDMRQATVGDHFDLILNLFTSFGYFADAADDRLVIRAAGAMLKPGGRFLLEVVNGDRIMANFEAREWFTVGQIAVMERRSLDVSTRRLVVERTVSSNDGSEVTVHALRLYGGRDLLEMLTAEGFATVDLYGDWNGEPLTAESLRVLAVGTKA